jgi:hypothetical protein
MIVTQRLVRAGAALLLLTLNGRPASALPTMIRLGYSDCVSCHLSPQGGGLLNEYGRGIDQAQSLRGGEYTPLDDNAGPTRLFGRRITQDVRSVIQFQSTYTADQPAATVFRPRLMYRNVTEVSGRLKLFASVTGETQSATRPSRAYDSGARPSSAFVNAALVQVRVRDGLDLSAGRDQLPVGINIPDLGVFVRSRNRLGYYDAPTQLKLFWSGARYHVTPYAFVDGRNEPADERESGGGTLVEFDPIGKQRTIVGLTLQQTTARTGDRRMAGGYIRLGFGAWGLLAEHDVTRRTRTALVSADSIGQQASFAQLFWATREWLVVSAIGESLRVADPFPERLAAGKIEVAARLRSEASLAVSARVQRDLLTGRLTRSFMLQAAVNTVR